MNLPYLYLKNKNVSTEQEVSESNRLSNSFRSSMCVSSMWKEQNSWFKTVASKYFDGLPLYMQRERSCCIWKLEF